MSLMLTKKDLIEIRKGLVTKDDLDTSFKSLSKRIDDTFALVMKIIGDGFDKVEGRLGSVENRLGEVENRLDMVATDLTYVKGQVANINVDTPSVAEFKNHEKRITRLEEISLAH